MTNINVLFEIPEDILKGLADGRYERVGGVIRKVDSKTVVSWLSEAGESISDKRLPGILGNQQMIMGLQVANLAVSAVGFAMIYHKLKKVEFQLQNLDRKIDEVKKAQDWFDKKQLITHLATLTAAVKTVQSAHRFRDKTISKDKLIAADNTLGAKSEYFRQVLGDMLASKLENERPDEFVACYQAWCMANQGLVNAMVGLKEVPEAVVRLNDFKTGHGEFGKQYQSVRQDYMRKITSGEKGTQAALLLSPLGQQMVGVHGLIKGQILQLDYLEKNKLRQPEPDKYRNQAKNGYLIFRVES